MISKPSDEQSTPDWVFALASQMFGGHSIDVAASDDNFLVHPYLTKHQDALSMSWCTHGHPNAWCNPPYSNPLSWVEKAIEEVELHPFLSITMLVPSDTSTKWYRLCEQSGRRYHFDCRISFKGQKHSAKFGSMFVRFDRESLILPAERSINASGYRKRFIKSLKEATQ